MNKEYETITVDLSDIEITDDFIITDSEADTVITNWDEDLTITHVPIGPINPDRDPKGDRDIMGMRVDQFLKSLLDPEGFGHAVTAEVRDEARVLLGMKKTETIQEEE